MKRFKRHVAGYGGWSEWTCPTPDTNFLFKCCDCGLVHEVQFTAFVERNRRRGIFTVVPLPKEIRVRFRMRRSRVR